MLLGCLLAAAIGVGYIISRLVEPDTQSARRAVASVTTGKGYQAISFFMKRKERRDKSVLVAEVVADRNARQRAQRHKFVRDGWAFVTVPAPDSRVLALDPALLGDRESEIQEQIQSNSFSGEALDRVRDIALKTNDGKTRYLAIEALARSDDLRAQTDLLSLYDHLSDERAKSQVIGSIRPRDPAGPAARFLVDRMSDESLSEETRRQAAFGLIAMDLARSRSDQPDAELMRRIPAEYQDDFRRMFVAARTGGGGR